MSRLKELRTYVDKKEKEQSRFESLMKEFGMTE